LLGALGILATRRELMLDLFVSDENAHRGLFTFRFYKNGEWREAGAYTRSYFRST
jgi:hypothetical protein